MPISVVPSGSSPGENPRDRKDELRAWLKEALPTRTLIIQDPPRHIKSSGEVYEILDSGLESLGLVGSKGPRFGREEFLRVMVKLLVREKGINLQRIQPLERVKQEALPLKLEMTEEVYRTLLDQGVRFRGHSMYKGDDWLDLRPEENDRICFVFDRMRQVEMIVEENSTVGKGQILLYPIENGIVMTEKKRLLPKAVGSGEESVMYLPEELDEARIAHFQSIVNRHYSSDTHQVKVGQPRKQGDGVTESLGIYLIPEITGKEAYLNDLVPGDGSPKFSDETFVLHLRQALNTLGISFEWK